ncbi:hypothetical protein ACC807_38030, partial [Rhizobium ruizarguesonis]
KPFQSEIPTKMQACASPGFYCEVTPTEGITDAMKALFLKVIRAPRITSERIGPKIRIDFRKARCADSKS